MEYLNQIQRAYNSLLNNDNLGRYGAGNIDLYKRPQVKNADGSISTVRSFSFNDGDKEILIPLNNNFIDKIDNKKIYIINGEGLIDED